MVAYRIFTSCGDAGTHLVFYYTTGLVTLQWSVARGGEKYNLYEESLDILNYELE